VEGREHGYDEEVEEKEDVEVTLATRASYWGCASASRFGDAAVGF
jgi:hypothetical protein